MTWDGQVKVREILQAVLARYLEQYGLLVEFKPGTFPASGDNRLIEVLHNKSGEDVVHALENIGKRILHVTGRNSYIVTLSPIMLGTKEISVIVTNFEEVK